MKDLSTSLSNTFHPSLYFLFPTSSRIKRSDILVNGVFSISEEKGTCIYDKYEYSIFVISITFIGTAISASYTGITYNTGNGSKYV